MSAPRQSLVGDKKRRNSKPEQTQQPAAGVVIKTESRYLDISDGSYGPDSRLISFNPIRPRSNSSQSMMFTPKPPPNKDPTVVVPKPQPDNVTHKPVIKIEKFNQKNRFQLSGGIPTAKKPLPSTGGRSKIKRDYKKDDMEPTSVQLGIDPTNQGHPVTVPFLDPKKKKDLAIPKEQEGLATASVDVKEEDEKDDLESEADMYRAKQDSSKYGQKYIQTSLAEGLFRNEKQEYVGEDELLFIQLPTTLPVKTQPTTTTNTTTQMETPETLQPWGFKNNLGQIPRGRIGKLYILKSGKVKMKIGDVVYDIAQGMPLGFLQELVAIDLKTSKLSILGDVNKRMVAYPDIEALVKPHKEQS